MINTENSDIITALDSISLDRHFSSEHFRSCAEKIKGATGLLHITTNLEAIKASKHLKPSAGGLGGAVYTVPVFESGDFHNLGTYLRDEEIPMFLRNQGKDISKIDSILIEPADGLRIGIVNYLEWGNYYYDIAFSSIDKKDLAAKVDFEKRIAEDIVTMFEQSDWIDPQKMSPLIARSAIIKPVFFETILEYLFSQQTQNPDNELSNGVVKNIIFHLNPELAKIFSLNNFTCLPEDMKPYADIQSLLAKLCANINKYFVMNEKNLTGYVMFRGFNLRKLLEQEFAKILWDEAARKEINVITYPVPKGELGALPVCGFEFFQCDIQDNRCHRSCKINLQIDQELTVKNTVMRNPYAKREVQ